MVMKMAVISDIHYSDEDMALKSKGRLGDILLLRAVHRINRMIRPDVTVLLGDLLNDGSEPDSGCKRRRLMECIWKLESPVIVIPGNHDGNADDFYRDFPRPPAWIDIRGHRLVPFLDAEEPAFNARRSAADLQRMLDARADFNGPIIQLQHTALFPPELHPCPYNYNNIEEITTQMRKANIRYSVSGHYHPGIDGLTTDTGTFIVAPALCEEPFTFMEIVIDNERMTATRHPLQMPPHLKLFDAHVHTPMAYCSENMDVVRTVELAAAFGLAGMAFSEHSGHLYFTRQTYWSGHCLTAGLAGADAADNRMEDYLALIDPVAPPARIALEVDCDFDGQLLVHAHDRNRVEFLLGAIHVLPSLRGDRIDPEKAADEFLAELQTMVRSEIEILAHPFRVFRRAGQPAPERLYAPVIRLLRDHGVAAEINFHTNTPDPEFFAQCLRAGVKVSLGSDAHNLYEVGEFAPHLELLAQSGCQGDLRDILWRDGLLNRG